MTRRAQKTKKREIDWYSDANHENNERDTAQPIKNIAQVDPSRIKIAGFDTKFPLFQKASGNGACYFNAAFAAILHACVNNPAKTLLLKTGLSQYDANLSKMIPDELTRDKVAELLAFLPSKADEEVNDNIAMQITNGFLLPIATEAAENKRQAIKNHLIEALNPNNTEVGILKLAKAKDYQDARIQAEDFLTLLSSGKKYNEFGKFWNEEGRITAINESRDDLGIDQYLEYLGAVQVGKIPNTFAVEDVNPFLQGIWPYKIEVITNDTPENYEPEEDVIYLINPNGRSHFDTLYSKFNFDLLNDAIKKDDSLDLSQIKKDEEDYQKGSWHMKVRDVAKSDYEAKKKSYEDDFANSKQKVRYKLTDPDSEAYAELKYLKAQIVVDAMDLAEKDSDKSKVASFAKAYIEHRDAENNLAFYGDEDDKSSYSTKIEIASKILNVALEPFFGSEKYNQVLEQVDLEYNKILECTKKHTEKRLKFEEDYRAKEECNSILQLCENFISKSQANKGLEGIVGKNDDSESYHDTESYRDIYIVNNRSSIQPQLETPTTTPKKPIESKLLENIPRYRDAVFVEAKEKFNLSTNYVGKKSENKDGGNQNRENNYSIGSKALEKFCEILKEKYKEGGGFQDFANMNLQEKKSLSEHYYDTLVPVILNYAAIYAGLDSSKVPQAIELIKELGGGSSGSSRTKEEKNAIIKKYKELKPSEDGKELKLSDDDIHNILTKLSPAVQQGLAAIGVYSGRIEGKSVGCRSKYLTKEAVETYSALYDAKEIRNDYSVEERQEMASTIAQNLGNTLNLPAKDLPAEAGKMFCTLSDQEKNNMKSLKVGDNDSVAQQREKSARNR